IRTAMQFSAPAARQRTILVTSAQPEDGKTTVACNLALAAALAGRRVLLVDANFRKAAVHRIFKVERAQGLSHLLVAQGSLESCVVRTNVAGLDILPAGPVPPNPAELLGSEPCRAFLAAAASQYDQVIIDSAPVLVASDAVVLATAVDGVVMVVRAKQSTRGVSRRASQLLHDVGAHLFGVVLNAAQAARGGYFREQLRTFYEYQDEETAK
ncbi:MAG: CpsD/CapB family tyrosine-protein kinase, partial [Planctomycetota bacterium]